MSFLDAYKNKILYSALVLGTIGVLAYDCEGCSCKGGGLDRFAPTDAQFYRQGEEFLGSNRHARIKNSLEEQLG